jgi:hypothetical protein
MTTDIFAPLPAAPCEDCARNPQGAHEDCLIVWCSHNHTGGIYFTEIAQWQISGPYQDEACFKRALFANLARKLSEKTH